MHLKEQSFNADLIVSTMALISSSMLALLVVYVTALDQQSR